MLNLFDDRELVNTGYKFVFGTGAHSPTDSQETETHYFLSVDLPGVPKKDVKIELSENVLTISGERKDRSYGKFTRAYSVPTDVDVEKIEASYEDGVLTVALPKTEAAKPRQIKIAEGKPSFFSKLVGGDKTESTN